MNRVLDKRSWKRLEWTMITKRDLKWFEFEGGFCGVLKMMEVTAPFKVGKNQVTICDRGITWIQCAWKEKNLWATAMYDQSGNLFQIYFDIADEIHFEGEKTWFADLIVDVVYEPEGTAVILDEDEIEEAYAKGLVSTKQRDNALKWAQSLKQDLERKSNEVNGWFCELYRKCLVCEE